MIIIKKDGTIENINRFDYLTDTEYYSKIIYLKFYTTKQYDNEKTNKKIRQKKKEIINKNNIISIIKKTTCM